MKPLDHYRIVDGIKKGYIPNPYLGPERQAYEKALYDMKRKREREKYAIRKERGPVRVRIFCKDCKHYAMETSEDDEGEHPCSLCRNPENMSKARMTYDPITGPREHRAGEYFIMDPGKRNKNMDCSLFEKKKL
jgi:hypothetical protein